MHPTNHHQSKQNGFLLIYALVFMALLMTASSALLGYTTQQIKGTKQTYNENRAIYLAEAAINKAIYQLNQSASYAGESDTPLGDGTFSVSIASIDTSNKRITATGYIPNSTSPTETKTIQATASIDATTVSFNFGVQVGEGGLNMNNNSVIYGNIFSNGNITGSGTITGDATVAAGTSPTPEQTWTTQNSNFSFDDISARKDVAQSFIPSTSGTLNKIQVYVKKVGSPSDLTLRLMSDNSGKPSKTVRASGTIAASLITGNYSYIDGSFSSSYNVTAGTKYWIMLSGTVNASNYFVWGYDSADGYASNTGKYSTNWNASSPVWNNAGGDLNFKTYMGGVTYSLSGVHVQGNAYAENMSSCTVDGGAYYQSISSCSVGSSHPGSTPQSPQTMPISQAQIDAWEDEAEAGGVINGSYNLTSGQQGTLGPKKINGDLNVSNNATLYLTGPLWVTGNITLSNNTFVRADSSLGNNSAVLIADNPSNPSGSGAINVSNNSDLVGNNNPGSYILAISAKTSNTAINLSNNTSGAIFYAPNAAINVSNNASAVQLSGYSIQMNNNATVNYQTGLQNITFSSGPGGSWIYKPGSYVITQ